MFSFFLFERKVQRNIVQSTDLARFGLFNVFSAPGTGAHCAV